MIHFIRVWIKSKRSSFVDWLFTEQKASAEDELALLRKRFLANKSWFDRMSSGWHERSFFNKTVYISGVVMIAGIIGSLVGATGLFLLSATILSLITHTLLGAHENKRHENAAIFAELAIAGKKSAAFFAAAEKNLLATHVKLAEQADIMQASAATLDVESQQIHQQNEALAPLSDSLTTETNALLQKNKAVGDGFDGILQHMNDYDEALDASTVKVLAIGEAAGCFSSAVKHFETSQQKFSSAVNDFCLFAQKPALKKESLEGFDHKRQIEADDELIATLKMLYPEFCV